MSALVITTDQAALIQAMSGFLQTGFSDGVVDNTAANVLASIEKYSTLDAAHQKTVREVFLAALAVFLKELNIQTALTAGITTTVALAQITPSGTPGSLTFTSGILTGYVAPT